jgi:dienelactone hydrolase
MQEASKDAAVLRARFEAALKALKAAPQDAGAEVTLIAYPNARHSFTVPDAAKLGMEAVQYDADADRKPWDATIKMFREAFKT